MAEKRKVTEKGQVTIPKKVREKTGIKKNSEVKFEVKDGEAIIFPNVEDPLEELKRIRKEVKFSEKEIDSMIKDSKEKWSKLS